MEDLEVNDVGTPAIHQKHTTVLEKSDSGIGRARVTNQLFIDKLLINKSITIPQHQAAERLLAQAVNAGAYIRSPNMVGAFGSGIPKGRHDLILGLSRTLRRITQEFSEQAAHITYSIVIEDKPTKKQSDRETLQEVLDFI